MYNKLFKPAKSFISFFVDLYIFITLRAKTSVKYSPDSPNFTNYKQGLNRFDFSFAGFDFNITYQQFSLGEIKLKVEHDLLSMKQYASVYLPLNVLFYH